MIAFERISLLCCCCICIPLFSGEATEQSSLYKLSQIEMNMVAEFLCDKDFAHFAQTSKDVLAALKDQLAERKKIYDREQFALTHVWTFDSTKIEYDYLNLETFQNIEIFKRKVDEYLRTNRPQPNYGIDVDFSCRNIGQEAISKILNYLLIVFKQTENPIVKLDLSGNQLTRIPADLARMPLLQGLRLWHSPLTYKQGMFKGMEQLRTLDLSENRLSVIPDIFEGLDRLSKLNLCSNDITHLAYAPLKSLRSLEKLYVIGNRVANLDIEILDRLKKLMIIDMSSYRGHFQQNLEQLLQSRSFKFVTDDYDSSTAILERLIKK